MTERRSSADLGPNMEAALGAFPFPERDWESDARTLEARFTESARKSTDATLLRAPLPAEPGEPSSLSATTTPLTSSGVRTQSLAEMARRSVEQNQAAARDMARETLALAAQKRPSGEEAAALREAVSAVRAVAEAPSPPPSSASAQSARASLPAKAAASTASSRSKISLVGGGLALAAALLLWLKQPAPAPAPLVSNDVVAAAAQDTAQSPAASPAPVATDHPATAAVAATAVDPNALSEESAAKTAEAAHAKVAALAPAAAAPAVSASAAGPAPEKFVLEEDQPSAVASAKPAEKPVEQALPTDPALRPADSTGGAIPVKPSTGAVQAALGAVMSGARHCVAGDEEASSAVVVFASDGHVQSVSVHGPAAGKPSATCIEGQLSRARVQPFAAQSFSVNATVRPD
ncbi:MAG TPA: hypothetical protein VK745_31725 [Polyangiaceae bacterium]|nr:hypothetical protein [Polyangiaceae bacterium]